MKAEVKETKYLPDDPQNKSRFSYFMISQHHLKRGHNLAGIPALFAE